MRAEIKGDEKLLIDLEGPNIYTPTSEAIYMYIPSSTMKINTQRYLNNRVSYMILKY